MSGARGNRPRHAPPCGPQPAALVTATGRHVHGKNILGKRLRRNFSTAKVGPHVCYARVLPPQRPSLPADIARPRHAGPRQCRPRCPGAYSTQRGPLARAPHQCIAARRRGGPRPRPVPSSFCLLHPTHAMPPSPRLTMSGHHRRESRRAASLIMRPPRWHLPSPNDGMPPVFCTDRPALPETLFLFFGPPRATRGSPLHRT